MEGDYQRFLTPNFVPFDPVELARRTEGIVCRGNERKYTAFYKVGVYGGIATGYTCGCCLRCFFCWVDWSRDFPERYGRFYSGREAFEELERVARSRRIKKARISGGEPTLGKEHLLELLENFEASNLDLFILETNGILFGTDRDYVKAISRFKKVHTRVSLKAGTAEDFTRKTGAKGDSFDLPFQAIRYLIEFGASFHVAAMSADRRVMGVEEREELIQRLRRIDSRLAGYLEEEIVDPYPTTVERLKLAGVELKWRR